MKIFKKTQKITVARGCPPVSATTHISCCRRCSATCSPGVPLSHITCWRADVQAHLDAWRPPTQDDTDGTTVARPLALSPGPTASLRRAPARAPSCRLVPCRHSGGDTCRHLRPRRCPLLPWAAFGPTSSGSHCLRVRCLRTPPPFGTPSPPCTPPP